MRTSAGRRFSSRARAGELSSKHLDQASYRRAYITTCSGRPLAPLGRARSSLSKRPSPLSRWGSQGAARLARRGRWRRPDCSSWSASCPWRRGWPLRCRQVRSPPPVARGARSCSGAGGRLRPHASRRLNGGVVRHCVGRAHAMRWKVTIADAKPMRLLMSRDVPGNAAEVTAPARPPLSTQSPQHANSCIPGDSRCASLLDVESPPSLTRTRCVCSCPAMSLAVLQR